MNTLLRHIEYLISRTDHVIIPGVGAILATDVRAMYDEASGMFLPPHRVYTFNSELRHNDGVLLSSIQRAERVSYDAASARLNSEVESLLGTLSLKGCITLGHIGLLTLSDDGSLLFEPTEHDSLSLSPWLPAVPVSAETTSEPRIVEAPIQKRTFTLRKMARAAASVAVLLAVGFVASTPISVDNATLASLAPEISHVDVEDIVPAKPECNTLNIIADSRTFDSYCSSVETGAIDAPVYYVIVATLANKSEAEKYLQIHRDPNLQMMNRGRYYTVYTSVHHDVYEAYNASLVAANKYPGAWVLK